MLLDYKYEIENYVKLFSHNFQIHYLGPKGCPSLLIHQSPPSHEKIKEHCGEMDLIDAAEIGDIILHKSKDGAILEPKQ